MRKLIYGMNLTLDGYIAAPGDDLGWSGAERRAVPVVARPGARRRGLSLYGRKLWETMSSYWPTGDQQPGATPAEIEFARNWRDTPKVVFSSTIDRSTGTPAWSPATRSPRSPGSRPRTAARWASAAQPSPGRPCGPG